MTKYIGKHIMNFWNIFKDDNDINEKSVVGFISFAIMVIYAVISVVGNLMGYDIMINETIYNSFVTVTLGSFGIATIGQGISNYSNRGNGYSRNNYGRNNTPHQNNITDTIEEEESEYERRTREQNK